MSVTRGDSAESYEPVMNIKGEAARLVSGPEADRHVVDHAPGTGEGVIDEKDVADIWPFLSQFEDKVLAVTQIMVHVEGTAGMDYLSTHLSRNKENSDPRAPGEPGEYINSYDSTAQFEFYTGASALDEGSADAGSKGDGHQYETTWRPVAPHQYLMALDEDDSIVIRTQGDTGDEADANAKWRFDYGVFEYLD